MSDTEDLSDVTMQGICELWVDVDDLDADCAYANPELVERLAVAASLVCFRLGGNRWPGVCTDSVQPGSCGCAAIAWPVEGGVSLVSTCGDRHGLLRLPQFPVVEIDEIRVRGVVLDPSAYRIVDDEFIVRVDGASWPSNSRVGDQPPIIEVDYQYGARPSELGRRAATVLCNELLLAVCESASCRLDRRVQTITRQNVTIEAVQMPGLVDALVQGQIGLPEVDLFVAAENPSKLRREGRFVVPGDPSLNDHRVR